MAGKTVPYLVYRIIRSLLIHFATVRREIINTSAVRCLMNKLTEIYREEFEVFILFEQKLEMVSYEVDAFLEQFFQV